MMMNHYLVAVLAAGLASAACSNAPDRDPAATDDTVSIRNLSETQVAADARRSYPLQGQLIATPSDTKSRYFLLRERQNVRGNVIAIVRQEHADKIAYARAEIDCGNRLFHVLGVGPDRRIAEATSAYDGPLRSMTGLPLRQEIAAYVCRRNGTPLAAA